MSVSGLVVSVADDEAAERVAELVRQDGAFTFGARLDRRLTVALNVTDAATAERKHEWVRQLPGVVKVDVAFVFLGTEEATDVR